MILKLLLSRKIPNSILFPLFPLCIIFIHVVLRIYNIVIPQTFWSLGLHFFPSCDKNMDGDKYSLIKSMHAMILLG